MVRLLIRLDICMTCKMKMVQVLLSTAMDASSPQLTALQDQIKVLSDLQSRLSAIRQVPASLLRQPIGNNDPFNSVRTQGAKEDFQKLRELGDEIRSDSVQKALHGAKERMEADGSHLDANYRRDSRKRR